MTARHVYVHIPFCARRCSYCDFAIAVRREVPADDYLSGIVRETELRFPDGGGGELDTVYLGGGTPSRLGVRGIANLLAWLGFRWRVATDAEVTLEANPEDVTPDAARAWLDAGVNRVSLGVQSFDDRVLTWMHRAHDALRARAAARALHDAGVSNWSLDLIYALPAELERDWARDLEAAVELEPPHISCYGLTIEAHTPLAHWRSRGALREAGEDAFATEFLLTHETLTRAGFEHYEVSNYGIPGRRARHNSAYWERTPYIGLGPSAHSFDGIRRRWNEREYALWRARLKRDEDPVSGHEQLTDDEVAVEEMYLGLRTNAGVQLRRTDRRLADDLIGTNWARIVDDRLQLTAEGWLRLDAIVAALTDHPSHS